MYIYLSFHLYYFSIYICHSISWQVLGIKVLRAPGPSDQGKRLVGSVTDPSQCRLTISPSALTLLASRS
jgi:hypothetical protein